MKFRSFSMTVLVAGLFSLSACNDDGSAQGDGSGAVTPAVDGLGVPAPGQMSPGFASAYTEFDLAKCEDTHEIETEGPFARFTCAKFGDIPLFVEVAGARFDLDAGSGDGDFYSINRPSEIGDTIEWRLEGGEPFALIFSYVDQSEVNPEGNIIAVETVGAPGKPACHVAYIVGDSPDHNQLAREKADAAAAPDYICPDEVEWIGRGDNEALN